MANGTPGNDLFRGSLSGDLYNALQGDDILLGLQGDDNLDGNENNDEVYGNEGNDLVRGGQGNDLVRGGQNNDRVYGDAGSDTVSGDLGDDIVVGGNGLNNLADPAGDRDLLYGNQGNDQLFGNEGQDTLYGGKDDDTLRGGKDGDRLFGDLGNDWLYGDLGADTLTGGDGADRFVLGIGTGGSAVTDADYVLDFTAGVDIIELINGLTFTDLNIFQGTGANAGDTIIQNRNSGEFLAVLVGISSTTITAANFSPFSSSPSPSPAPSPAPLPTPAPAPVPTPTPTPPTLSLAAGTAPSETGPANATFTLTRVGDTTTSLTVPYTLTGNATAGTDYTGTATGNFVFAAGSATATVTIAITDDTVVDPNESLTLTFTPPTGAFVSGATAATVAIADNDLPAISIASGATPQEAGAAAGTLILTRTGDISAALDVTYTVAGTATEGTDYTALSKTVTFAAGSPTATINVPTLDDTTLDPGETVAVTVTAPTGYSISGNATATLTIVDNDLPTISIAADTTTPANETGPAPGTFTLTRTGDLTAALTVNYTLSGTATATDYTDAGAGVVTFAAGSATATITLNTLDDTDFDPDELVTATIAPPAGYAIAGSATAQLAITDNELPTVSIVAGATPDEDGPIPGTFIVTRTGSAAQLNAPLDVTYTAAGTATATDYTALSSTVSFAAGSATAVITLPTLDDTDIDPGETVVVTLTAPTGYAVTGTPATLTIEDNDFPTISIAADTTTPANETGPAPGTFTLTRTGDLTAALTVNYTLSGTATATDYTDAGAGVVTFAAGSATATISLTTLDDADFDPNEVVSATIAPPAGYNIAGSATAQLTITDNELPTISIVAGATPIEKVPVTPGAVGTPAPGTFILTRTGDLSAAVTVNYAVAGTAVGGAAAGTGIDYDNTALPAAGTVTFAAGSANAVITVPVFDDTDIDVGETVDVTLTAPAGYSIPTPTASLTIIDDESPTVTITADPTAPNEAGAVGGSFTITLNTPAPAAGVVVPFTVSGTAVGGAAAGAGIDYNNTAIPTGLPPSGSVTIAAGATTATLTLPVFDDADLDPNETVAVTISAPAGFIVGGTGSASLTILDDETNTVDVTPASTVNGSESGAAAGTFTLTRTGNIANALNVNYTLAGVAINGTDYTDAGAGIATFAAGVATATVTITPIDDALGEGVEDVAITLAAGAGYNVGTTATGSLTIADNDGTPGADVITGGATPGVLFGGDGDDAITAGAAGDVLIGGNGNDNLTGGAGADQFRFNSTVEGIDTINGFTTGVDKIGVAVGTFGAFAAGYTPVAGTQFINGTAANGAGAPQFIYDTATGNLLYDADGVAGGETQIATIAGAPAFASTDIVYV